MERSRNGQALAHVPEELADATTVDVCERNGSQMLRYLRKWLAHADAEDVLQETMVALLEAMRGGRYSGEGNPSAYAYSIARHKAVRLQRCFWYRLIQRRVAQAEFIEELPFCPRDTPIPSDEMIQELLATLTPRERSVVDLRLHGKSYREIAEAIGVSEANAGQLYHRAVLKLRAAIAAKGE